MMRMASPESHGPGEEAEALLLALLDGTPEGVEPDVEPLCLERPDLSDELHSLSRGYGLARRALQVVHSRGDDGRWQELLSRPYVPLDLFFQITLESASDEPCVVALDDVDVTSMNER